jgi:uncharacterized protein (TIGR02996 family)
MARFELSDGSSHKFWEVERAGTKLVIRFGKIGAKGQTQLKTFASAAAAGAAAHKLIAEKTKKGYAPAGAKAAAPVRRIKGTDDTAADVAHRREPKLESAIEASPDDPDAYLVYADWLQAQGDPRGELIVLQHAKKPAAKRRLNAQRAHFYGPLAEATDMLEAFPYGPLGKPTTWRWGYLESLWISNKFDRSRVYGEGKPSIDVAEALAGLLDHTSCRFLRELTVGIVDYESNTYAGIAKVIGKRSLPTLARLTLGDFYSEETELNWSNTGDLTPLYAAAPNLERLTVRSGHIKLGKLSPAALPELRELTIISGGFDKASLAAICSGKWPALEKLSLQLGARDSNITVKHLQPIFDGALFPKVVHLGLGNARIADEICRMLADSQLGRRLQSLSLALGEMGDTGAAHLAAGHLPKLATLDVSRNWIGRAGLAALKKRWPKVNGKDQQDDGGDAENRYISGYE